MKTVITGGAGFLAYHLCRKFFKDHEKILLLDIASVSLGEYPPNVTYSRVDIRNGEELNSAFEGADFVIHAAAALPLWSKKDIFDVNVTGTRNVLEAARKNRVKRVVHVSSTAVYGVPDKHPLEENDPLVGVGPYGESKIAAEKICEGYRQKGLRISIVRPKTFIGTGRMGVFQILYDWVRSGKKIPMIGNGQNRYQLLEVEDLTEVISRLLAAPPEEVNDVFNVGAEKFGTVLEDLGALCDFAGTKARPLPTPSWIVKPLLALFEKLKLSPLYPWIYKTADKDSFVSVAKLKKAVPWSAKWSNKEALIRSYQWYLENLQEGAEVGITHRTAWKQGILGLIKKAL